MPLHSTPATIPTPPRISFACFRLSHEQSHNCSLLYLVSGFFFQFFIDSFIFFVSLELFSFIWAVLSLSYKLLYKERVTAAYLRNMKTTDLCNR